MGSCISLNSVSDYCEPLRLPTAKVILMDGSIQEFSGAVKCQEILSKYAGHFICNSDGLYSGRHISGVLHEQDELRSGEVYFLLPMKKLEFVLKDSDMASLLVKANTAMEQGKRKSKGKVRPLFDIHVYGEDLLSSSAVCSVSKPVAPSAGIRRKQRKRSQLETILEC